MSSLILLLGYYIDFFEVILEGWLFDLWISFQKSKVGIIKYWFKKGGDIGSNKIENTSWTMSFKAFCFFLAHHPHWNIEPRSNNIAMQRITHLLHKNMFLISVSSIYKWHFSNRWLFWPVGQDLQWWIETSYLRIDIFNYMKNFNTDL